MDRPRQGCQFLQTDPIGSKDDLDLYAYTADDPIDHSDPTGTQNGPVVETPVVAGETAEAAQALSSPAAAPVATGPGQWQPVNENMSANARAYQAAVTGKSGEAYVVNGVKFDGYAPATKTLVDAKASYGSLVVNGSFRFESTGSDIYAQAMRQTQAVVGAGGGYNITWKVQDASTASAIRGVFKEYDVTNIKVQVVK